MRLPSPLWSAVFLLLFTLAPITATHAVPAFARQTGMDCTECHMSWLELTSTGRRFKLGGYRVKKALDEGEVRPLVTLSFDDPPPQIPIAFAVQGGVTSTSNTHSGGVDQGADFPKQRDLALQQASAFLAGNLFGPVSCFCQWTYDGVAHHGNIDNTEIRIGQEYQTPDLKVTYGMSLNNNPTMSDVFNTTPVWGWPYIGSSVAVSPPASTLINGSLAQSVVGVTGYALVNRNYYVELGGYQTSSGAFSVLHAGLAVGDRTYLSGTAPYYRVAYTRDWDNAAQSIEVGAFGLSADVYPNSFSPSGPTNHYADNAIDAQYQYITDEHRFSAMFTDIHERQTLSQAFAAGGASNHSDNLDQITAKMSYYYQKWYGVSAGVLRTSGTTDSLMYNTGDPLYGSANGSPNSLARVLEFDYLFSLSGADNHRTARIVLQYTSYAKFNGSSVNYNGFGRNASQNNSVYLALWALF